MPPDARRPAGVRAVTMTHRLAGSGPEGRRKRPAGEALIPPDLEVVVIRRLLPALPGLDQPGGNALRVIA